MRIDVLGVGFDNLTMTEAVSRGAALLEEPGCHYVVTPNPEIVEVCRENPAAMQAVNGADLVLPDGIGVVKGAAMLGTPLKEKTPGIEFAAGLMEKMAERGRSLYLLGAKPGVADLAAERLQKQFGALGARFLLDNKKQLCLTFDEGYENGYSGKILDTLKEKQVHAIFFVTYDFASQNPALIKRMIAEGHVVGNHTYRHLTMDEVTRAAATEEITVLHRYMEKNYHYKMTYFRFPKGEFSEDTLALAQELGYKSIFWSFAYADWDTQNVAEPAAALQKVTESTHPGAIFLLHAVSPTNAEILGQAIDSIRSQGYTFTTAL